MLGTYAWQALEAAVTTRFGAGIRDSLGTAVNCPSVAQTISTKCIFSVCVGHYDELLELCERGLDEVVPRARAKAESIRFDAIRLEAGDATLAGLAAYRPGVRKPVFGEYRGVTIAGMPPRM